MVTDQIDRDTPGHREAFPGQKLFQGTKVERQNSLKRRAPGLFGIKKLQSPFQQDVIFLTIFFFHPFIPSWTVADQQVAWQQRVPETKAGGEQASKPESRLVSRSREGRQESFGPEQGVRARP